ncbi:MAG TPA: NADH-quinone oxidoreductase subunit N [Candidatus Acidoferrales bacterium]|nr:NADH-quinone oxidoreductase subunit N [Candidatus Acidoferrales bacterium]
MFPPIEDIYRLAPELVACLFGMLIMVVDPFLPRERKDISANLGLLGALASMAAIVLMARHPGAGMYGLLVVDKFSIFLHMIIFGAAALVILAADEYLKQEGILQGEFYALVLFATCGMGIMAGAAELMTAFVGLEISSISSYILACYRRAVLKSHESAMKYFLLGSFATAFFLYGVAMVYGATGTTFLAGIAASAGGAAGNQVLMKLGFAMLFVGMAFKIATAPFQIWTPDVYEGAPTPVTALLASGPKAAAFAVLLRIVFTAFGDAGGTWFWIVWGSAALTMIVGNFAAVVQSNVKRMLAYSSIAHAGYMLVAVAAAGAAAETDSAAGIAAVLFYLAAYALMKLGAFIVVSHLGGRGEQRLALDDFAGLSTRQPVTAACLMLYLLSLLGLPLTAGFLGKLYIFKAALDARLIWLVVIMAITSVVGAFYYLRVIWVMYFREAHEELTTAPVAPGVAAVMVVTAAGILVLFFFPGAVMNFAMQGAMALR